MSDLREPPLEIELVEALPQSERIAYVLRREITVSRIGDAVRKHVERIAKRDDLPPAA